MMTWLWMLLPDEAIVLVIAVLGLAIMVRPISIRTAACIIGILMLSMIAGPFIAAVSASLPAWVSQLILVAFGWALLRGITGLFLGRRASDHMWGEIAARAVIGTILLPFRVLGWALRLIFGGAR